MNKVITQAIISERLIQHGQKLLDSPPEFIQFSKDLENDELTNDLEHYPHAYVIACVMDRQIKAEK